MLSRIARWSALAAAVVFLAAPVAAQVTFTAASHPLSQNPEGIATGDFNRDGMPDVAVGIAGSSTSSVVVFLATAPGQYGPQAEYPISTPGNNVVTGDFNGDGVLDILAGDGPLTLLLGNGDGSFRNGGDTIVFGRILGIAAGDFNGDGALDVGIVQQGPSASGASLHIFINHSDGTFTDTATLASVDTTMRGLVAADFNRDGNLDLATVASGPARGLVFFGDGAGNFGSPVTLSFANDVPAGDVETVGGVIAADFNNDAVPDLAIMAGYFCSPGPCGNDRANILLSDGSGGFSFRQQFTLFTSNTSGGFLASDLDSDLNQDIFYWNPSVQNGDFTYWHGNGDGSFSQMTGNYRSAATASAVARDLNLDSRHDLAFSRMGIFIPNIVVLTNTTGAQNCPPPGSDAIHAKICTPTESTQPSGSITFSGSGNSPAGIQRLELWIDGVKHYQTLNDQLLHSETLSAGSHLVELVAVDKYTGFAKTSMNINSGGGGGTCTAPSGIVNLCLPVNNSTVSSPVEFSGAGSMPSQVLLRLYVDNQVMFETTDQSFDTSIALPSGSHHAVLVGYSSDGAVDDQTSQKFFTVGTNGGGTCTAAPNSANLCSPVKGSTVNASVQFTGTANAATVYLLRLYLDDQPIFETSDSSFSTSIDVGSGSHHAVLVAYTSVGDLISESFFTVSGSGGP
jgi:FG-GAP-like repeat